jgi:hypothetical protein
MHRRHCAVLLGALFVFTASASAGNNANLVAPGQLAPISDALPTITGIAMTGQTFLGDPGKWNGPSSSYGYQWARCSSAGTACTAIALANAQTYLETAADVGSTLRVVVTASNKNGAAVTTSNPTLVVQGATSPPPPTTTTSTSTTTTTPTITATPTTSTTSSSTSTTTSTTTPTTTTTSTTTTTGSSGSVLYGTNWEAGALDVGGWGHQCADNTPINSEGTRRGTYAVVTGDTNSGTYAGRFDLPAVTGYSQACEALHGRLAGLGVDDFYALAIKLPTAWQSDPEWGLEAVQFNYEGVSGPPLGLVVHPSNAEIIVNTGNCSGPCQFYSGNGYNRLITGGPYYAIPPAQFSVGTWHQLIVHVHWTLGNDGVLEVWHRTKGQSTWTKTVSGSGFPTLQTGTRWDGYVVTASNIASFGTTDKYGAYRGPASYSMSVFHDDWCRATSFSAAAGCLG